MIGPHKNRTPRQGNIVKNNLVPKLELSKKGGSLSENNSVIDSSYTLFYKDPFDWNFRLKDGCSAINTGDENGAPSEDILGHHRPQGKAIDAGCYEKEEK